jgi:hypothetical protein
LTAGAVSTSSFAKAITGGYEVVSEAKLAGVNLLNGLITATAVDTTATSTLINGKIAGGAKTTFVGLKIVGIKLPVTIPANFHVTIPNVATVYLNYSLASGVAPSVMSLGMGLYVGLLKQSGPNAVGASVAVNPTYAALGPITIPKSGHIVRGNAFGSEVSVKAGSLLNVQSDPTAPVSMAAGGTNGAPVVSNIAGVNLTPLLHLGAVADSALSTNTNTLWESETTSKIAGLDLFSGAIKADAISSDAHVRGTSAGTTVTGTSGLVNLSIGGKAIPINTKPNTKISLAGLATITINKQTATANSVTVCAIDIVLLKANAGLPAGAEVQLAVASAGAS